MTAIRFQSTVTKLAGIALLLSFPFAVATLDSHVEIQAATNDVSSSEEVSTRILASSTPAGVLHEAAFDPIKRFRLAFQGRSLQSASSTTTILPDGNGEISNDAALQNVCALMEAQFDPSHPVSCTCLGSVHNFLTLSCEYKHKICNNSTTTTTTSTASCGRPILAMSIVQGNLFSATACVREFSRGAVRYNDTCITAEVCDNMQNGLCDCSAMYGSQQCSKCNVCGNGAGLTVDCSNVNPQAVTQECRAVDLDLNLGSSSSSSSAGTMAGFLPNFDGLCTGLEKSFGNKIECECSDTTASGNYNLACRSTEAQCLTVGGNDNSTQLCGDIETTVHIVDGTEASVTTCVDYHDPSNFAQTCTTVELCTADEVAAAAADGPNNNNNNKNATICGCTATYNGQACQSCKECENGTGVQTDCSNVFEYAIVDQCQPLSRDTSFEYIPQFRIPPPGTKYTSAEAATSNDTTSGGTILSRTVLFVMTSGLLLFSLLCW